MHKLDRCEYNLSEECVPKKTLSKYCALIKILIKFKQEVSSLQKDFSKYFQNLLRFNKIIIKINQIFNGV